MTVLLALAVSQVPAFTGTVPQPNPSLDHAHVCLRAGVAERLAENSPEPFAEKRWGWALTVAAKCEAEINAAADSKEAVYLSGDNVLVGIGKRELLRSEALYFVDRLIREHYEAQP